VTGKATGPHRNTAPFSVGDPIDGILVEKKARRTTPRRKR
jgi:hypothetical protein